jgi:helicase
MLQDEVCTSALRGQCPVFTLNKISKLEEKSQNRIESAYVKGVPEDLHSRFVAEATDPRTLILRVLAVARRASVKGVLSDDIINFLEGSFGAFQQKQLTANWAWDRAKLSAALGELVTHKLIESGPDGGFHLTELGRFAGEGGIEVESIIRLVEALAPLAPASINDPTLVALAQLTVEVDQVLFPINRKSTQKEPQTWFGELGRQHIPGHVLNSLKRFISDQHQATLRAKKAAACLLWISGTARCPKWKRF